MSVLTATKTFSIGTGAVSSTVQVTGIGFQPKALIFFWGGRTEGSDTVGRADEMRGIGMTISPTSRRSICSRSQDNVGTSSADSGTRDDACIIMQNSSGTFAGRADLQSLDSDGFTLVIDEQFITNLKITVQAIGGDEIEDVYIGNFTEPASAGNQDITAPGFTPSVVFSFMSPGFSWQNATGADSRYMIGVAAGDTPECAVIVGGARDNFATTDTVHYCLDGEFIASMNGSFSAIDMRGTLTAWLKNGFRINYAEVTGSQWYDIQYLAIKGGSHAVKSGLTQTDTSTPISFSSLNFKPVGGMVFSTSDAESSSDSLGSKDELIIGAFTGTADNNCQAVRDGDNVSTTNVTTGIEYDSVYANLGGGSLIGTMEVNGIGDQSIDFIMSDADDVQVFFFTWLIGDNPRNRSIAIRSKGTYYDSALNNLVQKIDENQVAYDPNFWANVQNGGGDIILKNSSGKRVAIDLRRCDTTGHILRLFIVGDFSSSGGDIFMIEYDADYTASQPAAASAYGAQNTYLDLFEYAFNLDENGSTFYDMSWNNRNASANGTLPNQVAGKNNYAQDFNGSSDFANLGDVVEGLSEYTKAAWINLDSDTEVWTQIECKALCDSFTRHYASPNNKLHGNNGDGSGWGSGQDSSGNLSLSIWTHVGVVGLSSGYVQLYIDGNYDTQGDTGDTMASNALRRLIGAADDGGGGETQHFDGRIETLWLLSDNKSAAWFKAIRAGQNNTQDVWEVIQEKITNLKGNLKSNLLGGFQ